MFRKLLIISCSIFFAHAGFIRHDYVPASTQLTYDQPEISPIYESSNTQFYMEDVARTFSKYLGDDYRINQVQITPTGPETVRSSALAEVSPTVYTTSAALPKPVSLPSYSIGKSPIIYNSKVTPGLSAFS